MRIFNSLSGKKEVFVPIEEGKVKIYACGPTVYNDMHIGNVRPQVVFDILRRQLMENGYEVTYVSNFTDVDDKIIKKANEENTDIDVITERYIASVLEDLKSLHVDDFPIIHPTCTGHMGEIIDFISGLIKKGYAYDVEGDVYFRVKKLDGYGKLSNRNIEELEVGARIEENIDKEDPLDFTLWKKKKDGEPFWKAPWGEGRPGWHIECSTMIKSIFGNTIDIHCGGEDLKFPHHENEIAQSEALNGAPLARYWMHNGMINIENVKMSKSLGNFLYAKDFMKTEGGEVLRYFIIGAHYRKPLNFNKDAVEAAKTSLRRLRTGKDRLVDLLADAKSGELDDELTRSLAEIEEDFMGHMNDDLNTPDAISDLFALLKLSNIELDESSSKETLNRVLDLWEKFSRVLGILKDDDESVPAEILKLVSEREEARANKDYKKSDELRDKIFELGYIIKDTKEKTVVTKR